MHTIKTLSRSDGLSSLPAKKVLFGACVIVLLVAAYLPVFSLYARQHWQDLNLQGAYAHAPLTLIVIAMLLWRQRGKLSRPMRQSGRTNGLSLLLVGVVLKIYGDVQGYDVLRGVSLIPVLLGLLYIYYDASAIGKLRFPVLLLLFVIPLPGAAIDTLTVPMIALTAECVALVLPVLDINVVKAGHSLTVNAVGLEEFHQVILAPECSGIRSFVSLLTLSSLFAHLKGRSAGFSTALLLMTFPLVVIGNILRVVLTILVIVYVSPDTAQNFFHWSSGLFLFVVTLLGLFIIDAAFNRTARGPGESHG